MKNILILGAGSCQLNAIHKIKEMGHRVIVSDNRLDSIGKTYADISILADTFSYEETISKIGNLPLDGILTSGTDQPVLTVSKLTERLNLPTVLSKDTALSVTNKKYMKQIFSKNNIPTVPYVIIKKGFDQSEISFNPPYVVKPIDSQGQRGIYKLNTIEEIREHFDQVTIYSRSDEILVEAYYPNRELTVSGWVDERVHLLTVTDRVTFSSDEHIGVCIAHEYPSIHLKKYKNEIETITLEICKAFEIKEGPIYFQYLVGDDGVMVNEIACRLGGAYEDVTIPYITGFDILQATINASLGIKEAVQVSKISDVFSTQLFFCNSGQITEMTDINVIKELPFVLDAGYNFVIGDVIGNIENASQRAGYVIIKGETEEALVKNISHVYDLMEIKDKDKNLIIRGKRYYR